MIQKISMAWITVTDLEKAEHFFSHTLGLTLMVSDKEHSWLEYAAAGQGFRLGVYAIHKEQGCCGQPEEQEKCCRKEGPGSNAVLTLQVADIGSSKKELESKGVQFISPIMEVPGQVKLATFVDPDNNQFQLVEIVSDAL